MNGKCAWRLVFKLVDENLGCVDYLNVFLELGFSFTRKLVHMPCFVESLCFSHVAACFTCVISRCRTHRSETNLIAAAAAAKADT